MASPIKNVMDELKDIFLQFSLNFFYCRDLTPSPRSTEKVEKNNTVSERYLIKLKNAVI